ncbi:MAG: hypothetical protein IT450_21840 [Phycisphaerales bacterium]|nr:hypothetical protein [Phycisphaerales bacterium]
MDALRRVAIDYITMPFAALVDRANDTATDFSIGVVTASGRMIVDVTIASYGLLRRRVSVELRAVSTGAPWSSTPCVFIERYANGNAKICGMPSLHEKKPGGATM